MPIQKKYFDEDTLLKKVNADALSGEQLASILENEISRVEQLKITLVDEIEKFPAPTVRIVNDIDSYIYNIQDILVDLQADRYSREVLSTERMQRIRDKIKTILAKGSL